MGNRPLTEQVHYIRGLWHMYTSDIRVEAISPYTASEENFERVVETLKDRELVIMDCIGYSYRHKRINTQNYKEASNNREGDTRGVLTEII